MSAMSIASNPMHAGGGHYSIFNEVSGMSTYIVLVILVLISVYTSRIPESVLTWFRLSAIQGISLVAIFLITAQYGWVHGILAVLAFALVISLAIRTTPANSGFQDYTPAVIFSNGIDTTLIPADNRWWSEKVLGENPFLIREREVKTSAVQDLSERSMSNSSVSR